MQSERLLLCTFVLHGASGDEFEGLSREWPLHLIVEHDESTPPIAEKVPSTDVGLLEMTQNRANVCLCFYLNDTI